MSLNFVKAHGLGNDMIIFDGCNPDLLADHIVHMCDRKYGIGGDCVISHSDGKVRFWNPDGTEANLCGNGCRCLIKYLCLKYGTDNVSFETKSGLVTGSIAGSLVEMKYPAKELVYVENGYYFVDVGNKHIVIFGNNDSLQDHLEYVDYVNNNIMFLTYDSDGNWFMDIYEAGAGETNACGSGAMAAAISIWRKNHHSLPIKIQMKGGVLEMIREASSLHQIGPAEIVYKGVIEL